MKKIAIVLFDAVEVLDFAGPFEVFGIAGRRTIGEPYEVFTVAERAQVIARNQLLITPTYTFANCPKSDIFLIPGGGGYDANGQPFGSRKEMDNPVMQEWIRQRATTAELVLSVCTGALILAKTGLLENLELTTHFLAIDSLQKLVPTARVSGQKRYVDNGTIILSAGVSAGIDMALYVVEKRQGVAAAREAAQYMQYDYWKPGTE